MVETVSHRFMQSYGRVTFSVVESSFNLVTAFVLVSCMSEGDGRAPFEMVAKGVSRTEVNVAL